MVAWLFFIAFFLFFLVLAEGLCKVASRPTPSPFERIADYSDGYCTNCPDLDACEDDACPHDWMDWGL